MLKITNLGNLSLCELRAAQRFCVFQCPLGFVISFQGFHANSAPRLHFPLIKTGTQTPLRHDKSLWSSHFSAKTIHRCVDSALQSSSHVCWARTPGSETGLFYWLLERRFRGVHAACSDSCTNTHALAQIYITSPSSGSLWSWPVRLSYLVQLPPRLHPDQLPFSVVASFVLVPTLAAGLWLCQCVQDVRVMFMGVQAPVSSCAEIIALTGNGVDPDSDQCLQLKRDLIWSSSALDCLIGTKLSLLLWAHKGLL